MFEKTSLNPSLQDWIDYLNQKYEWNENIGMSEETITPKIIELVLCVDGYLQRKEDQ